MSLTMQQASTAKVPQTRAELEAMVGRRSELQGQLRAVEERRFLLGEQVARTSAETRAPVVQRLEALDQRITQLERQVAQRVDAIALEVERISENQRYLTKVLHPGAAEPVETSARVGERVPPLGSRGR